MDDWKEWELNKINEKFEEENKRECIFCIVFLLYFTLSVLILSVVC